jgi:cob(I)alamin adenosyltransferase
MKIYTKTGDHGETGLYDGTRIAKDSLRVESYGTIDELDSSIGLARNYIEDEEIKEKLMVIQRNLFVVASQLASPDNSKLKNVISEADIECLEHIIDSYIKRIPEINKFILPGSNLACASLHVSRTICRRAERRILTLSHEETVDELVIKYVNRLSDCLYAMARYLESELIYM